MPHFRISYVALLMLLLEGLAAAMSFDNRFFPLVYQPFLTVSDERTSGLRGDFFMTNADRAFGQDGDEVQIPALFGQYDQQNIGTALTLTGRPNPLIAAGLADTELPWIIDQSIQSQAFLLYGKQTFLRHGEIGLNFFYMHVTSQQLFRFKNSETLGFTPEFLFELDTLRRQMQAELGLEGQLWNTSGLGDIELYIRLWNSWHYALKFRTIQAGLRFGWLSGSGVRMDNNNPASVPFGGNGHPGIYFAGDAEFEVKEDMKCGILAQINSRFSRTCNQRMPITKTPFTFGGVVGRAKIIPGVTCIVQPYALFENLRKGLAARVLYSFAWHQQDTWIDERADQSIPTQLQATMKESFWCSNYVTLHVVYDFGKTKSVRSWEPIVFCSWDLPVAVTSGAFFAKSVGMTLGIEFCY